MGLSTLATDLRDAVVDLLKQVSSDLGDPSFISREPTEKAYQALPALFVQIGSCSTSLLTNKTKHFEVELSIYYVYSDIQARKRFDQALQVAETIDKQLWSDPSVGGRATGIVGSITWDYGPPIDLGESEKFLHTVEVRVTYSLVPVVI